ncbi:MAG: hypothetical protein AAB073_01165 [Pseudomonadota bacterium]
MKTEYPHQFGHLDATRQTCATAATEVTFGTFRLTYVEVIVMRIPSRWLI